MASSSQDTGGEAAPSGSVAGAAEGTSTSSAVNGARPTQKPKSPKNVPPALAEMPAGLPPGKYKLVGWDIDTTGRRLIDEICQIAAYAAPDNKFSQHIMPYGDLNPGARRRHNVRVVSVGRYRMLKDTVTHKVVKTKSEISALVDFLNWLEEIKSKDQMIILIYHEPRRLYPTALIQSLIRQRLFDRFKSIVAGFTDSYALCAEKCKGTFKSVSLRVLAKLLLDEDEYHTDTALDRAIATYNIVEQLANQGGDYLDLGAGGEAAALSRPSEEMMEFAREFARPVNTEVEAFESLKDLLEKQNTFRTAFTPLLRAARPNRHRLTQLRRSLADAGLLYEQVKDAWHEGRRAGLANLFIPLEQTLQPEDIEELVELFDSHFISEKEPNVPRGSSRGLTEDSDELYLSSDSDNSDQLSSSLSASGQYRLFRALYPLRSKRLAAVFLGVEDFDLYHLGADDLI
ncbi:hypothetical protein PYW08_000167 [Mythimna loreyi]|uniref:Uncharacterized protein n=1 Tax=Mythimna loreyi TaxID=667449 RepID=A0ACC2RBF0_9NEOP|nr:hypothetical protein PYW08_000167 [Mythimna loreyi]